MGGNYTIEVPSSRYPFPSRYIILLYRSRGRGCVPRLKTYPSAPSCAAGAGVPGLAGAAVTQEAAAAQVAARGEGAGCSARCGAGQSGGAVFGAKGGERVGGGLQVFSGARAAPPAVSSTGAEPHGVSGRTRRSSVFRGSPALSGPSPFSDPDAAPTAPGLLFGLPGSARSASRPAALRLVSGGGVGAAPAGSPHPRPAAVMLLRLPPLRPGGQLAVAGAGVGARSPLAGTPPSSALRSRGRRGAPGPGAA